MPKGEDDIRMVFNGSSCGLNSVLFASNFGLPSSSTMTRLLSFGYKVVDMDIGEMFLNFPLHQSLRPSSGIDLSPLRLTLKNKDMIPPFTLSDRRLSATWSSLWFGLRPSPECACTYYYLAEEVIRSNHKDLSNPLRWDSVVLNLIGNDDYNRWHIKTNT